MSLQKCARCKKRPAMVFITKLEQGKSINEGICLVCANELGIKPVNDILKNMGMSEEDIENMSGEVEGMLTAIEPADDQMTAPDGGAPALDLQKLFSSFGMPLGAQGGAPKRPKGSKEKGEAKADESKKLLST